MYIKIYFFIIIPEYNKIEKQSGRVCVFQSLVLSFILGGIIVLTFALVDEKIYQEHRFPYIFTLWEPFSIFRHDFIFKYSTFRFEYALVASLFIPLLSLCKSNESFMFYFLFFFYLFSGWRNSNISDDYCLFSNRRCFCSSSFDCL